MKTKTTHRSGAGGSHIGFRMFGARGPLLQEADAGGGSSGGSEASETAEAQTAGDKPAGSPGEAKSFTQADVDRIVKERLDKERRKQGKPSPAPTPPAEDGEKLSLKHLQAQLEDEKTRRKFDRRVAKLGLDDTAADDLFTLYQAQKPQDEDAWFESKSKLFGGQATSSQTPPQDPKLPAAAPSAPNKVEAADSNGIVNIFALKPEQIAQMSPARLREHFEKILEYGRSTSGAPAVPRPSNRKG
jgi:hypothetical protein